MREIYRIGKINIIESKGNIRCFQNYSDITFGETYNNIIILQ